MHDWLRSLSLLAMAFVAVVVVTLGLSGVIVPDGPATAEGAPQSGASAPPVGGPGLPAATADGIPGLGGTLAVTGDLEGSFNLTGESVQESYALEGDEGRIVFGEGRPVTVDQISYEGWEFFPADGQCTLAPDNLDTALGIGFAELRCDDLEDIRDKGTISLAGEIGMPVDLLAESDLPPSGGTLTVGDETWTVDETFLLTWEQPIISGVSKDNLELTDHDLGAALNFHYDIGTHALTAVSVARDGEEKDVPPDSCEVRREELGRHNPRTAVVELTISCAAVDVPGLGTVPIEGTVVADELAWPE